VKHSSVLPVAWVALRTLLFLNWACAALIFSLLLLSFLAEDWTWQALGVGSIVGHERVVAGMRSIMLVGIVSAPIAFVMFRQLLRIVKTVREGRPFTLENAVRLQIIACALLALEVLHLCVVAIASAVSTEQVPLHISDNFHITGWLASLLLFVLAQVFLEGARMRDDLEGMV